MRIGTKSFLVLSFKQVGLWFIHPLSSGSSPPLSRLWTRLLRHPAFPLVHQLLLVRTFWFLLWSFMYSYVCWTSWYLLWSYIYICYADHMERSALKYRRHQLLASLHWCGAWGDTCGGKLALRAGGRRHPYTTMTTPAPEVQSFFNDFPLAKLASWVDYRIKLFFFTC